MFKLPSKTDILRPVTFKKKCFIFLIARNLLCRCFHPSYYDNSWCYWGKIVIMYGILKSLFNRRNLDKRFQIYHEFAPFLDQHAETF